MSYFDRPSRRHFRYSDSLSPDYGTREDDYTPSSSVTSDERPIRVRRYSRATGNKCRSRATSSTYTLGLGAENVALRAQLRYEKLKAEVAACTSSEMAYIKLGQQVQAAGVAASSRIDQGRELEQARQAWVEASRRAGFITGPYEY